MSKKDCCTTGTEVRRPTSTALDIMKRCFGKKIEKQISIQISSESKVTKQCTKCQMTNLKHSIMLNQQPNVQSIAFETKWSKLPTCVKTIARAFWHDCVKIDVTSMKQFGYIKQLATTDCPSFCQHINDRTLQLKLCGFIVHNLHTIKLS